MTPHTDTVRRDATFDARTRRIRDKILDGIEETLAELAQPQALRAAIEHIVRSQTAPLLCRQALCRRARRCRRKPCAVPGIHVFQPRVEDARRGWPGQEPGHVAKGLRPRP